MEIKGTIVKIEETQVVSDRFKKRALILEHGDNPDYLQYNQFEAHQDNCDSLNGFEAGDEVTIQYNLRGREWTNKEGKVMYFTTLQIWKVEKDQETPAAPPIPAAGAPLPPGSDNDLPF